MNRQTHQRLDSVISEIERMTYVFRATPVLALQAPSSQPIELSGRIFLKRLLRMTLAVTICLLIVAIPAITVRWPGAVVALTLAVAYSYLIGRLRVWERVRLFLTKRDKANYSLKSAYAGLARDAVLEVEQNVNYTPSISYLPDEKRCSIELCVNVMRDVLEIYSRPIKITPVKSSTLVAQIADVQLRLQSLLQDEEIRHFDGASLYRDLSRLAILSSVVQATLMSSNRDETLLNYYLPVQDHLLREVLWERGTHEPSSAGYHW